MKKIGTILSVGILGLVLGVVLTAKLNLLNNLGASNPQKDTEIKSEVKSVDDGKYITLPSFADIAEKILPSVVSIEAEGKKVVNFSPDPFFEFFFGPRQRVLERKSLGSGFIFKRQGKTYYILTNNHVIKDMDKITIKMSDGTTFRDVKVVGTDPTTDVAVLKFESEKELQVAKLGDSDKLRVGDWVMAIGSPFGLSSTVTVGVISAKHRSVGAIGDAPSIQDFLQTDAAINPGNSGGPLVNVKGEVVGINEAIISPTGAYAGVGFAIPINLAVKVADQIIKKGKVERGYLGIVMQDIDENLAKALKLNKDEGVIITEVVKDSPADKAGLKEGDVIIEVDGRRIKNSLALRSVIQSKLPGEEVKIKFLRDGKTKTVTVKLGSLKEHAAFLGGGNILVDDDIGLVAKYESGKVVVEDVKPNTPAASMGSIQKGDVILKVNDRNIRNLNDLKEALDSAKKRGSVIMFLESKEGFKKWVAFNL